MTLDVAKTDIISVSQNKYAVKKVRLDDAVYELGDAHIDLDDTLPSRGSLAQTAGTHDSTWSFFKASLGG